MVPPRGTPGIGSRVDDLMIAAEPMPPPCPLPSVYATRMLSYFTILLWFSMAVSLSGAI